jgi:hypothetical protein
LLPPKGGRGCSPVLRRAFFDRTEGTQGNEPAELSAHRKGIEIMAKAQPVAAPTKRPQPSKPPVTLERAMLLCPDAQIAANVSRSFGLDLPDYEAIRDAHAHSMRQMFNAFGMALNERATAMHFQRLGGSLVSSAIGAGDFYSRKLTEARDLTSALANDARDEDRDGPVGFESKADRARLFAAEMAMQAFALLAAAEGAVIAYKEITGDDWKPFVAPNEAPIERRSAAAELSAFG